MKRVVQRLLSGFAFAWFACGTCGAAQDETYPARPIRLLVGVPPGGAADFTARIVAQKLTDALGQHLVVENRGGAGGTIASDIASKSTPLSGPAGMPASIVRRIDDELHKLLALPDVKERFGQQGALPTPMRP